MGDERDKDMRVTVSPASLKGKQGTFVGHKAALVFERPDQIDLKDFVGEVRTMRTDDGRLQVEATGRPNVGRRNEPIVRKILRQALEAATGEQYTVESAPDDRGEDARLRSRDGKKEYVVQIVTMPPDSEYAKEIASGHSLRTWSFDEIAQGIRAAIEHKLPRIPPGTRGTLLLALDARRIGFVAGPEVQAALARTSPPIESYGFGQVWLVGHTAAHSVRLA